MTTGLKMEFPAQYASSKQLAKLVTVDADIREVPRETLATCNPALIDGEHTPAAVHSDTAHLLPATSANGVIAFHDVGLIRVGMEAATGILVEAGIPHRLYVLPDVVGVLALRGSVEWAGAACDHPVRSGVPPVCPAPRMPSCVVRRKPAPMGTETAEAVRTIPGLAASLVCVIERAICETTAVSRDHFAADPGAVPVPIIDAGGLAQAEDASHSKDGPRYAPYSFDKGRQRPMRLL